jgi:LysR family transcriptional activator of nhaA
MEWLNYHHLLYFWMTARTGSVTRASEELMLRQPTVSAQIRALEKAIGHRLFERAGRRMELTDIGRTVYSYADEIFALGRELQDTLRNAPDDRPLRLRVGVADVIPKLVAELLLRPAIEGERPVHLVVREDRAERLEEGLAAHRLDVVLSDAPLSPRVRARAFSHRLGSCGATLFAAPSLAAELREEFPKSLDAKPLLVPTEDSVLRGEIDHWIEREEIHPSIVGEFDDSALMKVFGQAGLGAFPGPELIADEIRRQYAVEAVGSLEGVTESFYAITTERRIRHEAVAALCAAARDRFPEE